jgi:hypothetical protein
MTVAAAFELGVDERLELAVDCGPHDLLELASVRADELVDPLVDRTAEVHQSSLRRSCVPPCVPTQVISRDLT